jgi:hypothetical protein
MRYKGQFVVRQVVDEIVAVPVGETAVKLNGMLLLNKVSLVIWNCLEQDTTVDGIVKALTDAFEVSPEEAKADTLEFLEGLRAAGLLEE